MRLDRFKASGMALSPKVPESRVCSFGHFRQHRTQGFDNSGWLSDINAGTYVSYFRPTVMDTGPVRCTRAARG
eukprot:10045445-Alexandrium_andersonii.AAC.1